MSYPKHQQFLDNHCRVCGKPFGKKTRYSCSKYHSIVEVFGVNYNDNNEEVHPESFCNNCYMTAKRVLHSAKNHPIPACVEWLPHDSSYCHICDGQRRGRPKKSTHPGGRPSFLTTHICSVASSIPTFTLSQVIDKSYINNITCSLCNSAVCEPVKVLLCKSLICCSCLLGHLDKDSDMFHCPGCSEEHTNTQSSFTKMSPIAENMINNMIVKCNKCYQPVKLSISRKPCDHHAIERECCNLIEAINRPLESPPTTMEKQVASSVVTRLLHHKA